MVFIKPPPANRTEMHTPINQIIDILIWRHSTFLYWASINEICLTRLSTYVKWHTTNAQDSGNALNLQRIFIRNALLTGETLLLYTVRISLEEMRFAPHHHWQVSCGCQGQQAYYNRYHSLLVPQTHCYHMGKYRTDFAVWIHHETQTSQAFSHT
jgi:hypothetical protein